MLPNPHPDTLRRTPYSAPVEESCGYNYISCGSTVQGSTLGFPNFIPNHETGIGDGGDAFYLVTVRMGVC